MIIVADSGSTKTDWIVVDRNRNSKHYRTIGFNPYHVDKASILEHLHENLIPHIDASDVANVHFYGAGCSEDSKCDVVSGALNSLFVNADVIVEHDLIGAARGLYPHGKGLVGILGTGSNTCLFDGKKITEGICSLGYVLGDEGGGVYMGKLFLSLCLTERLPLPLIQEFNDAYKLSKSQILDAIYKQPLANRFMAQFAEFIKKHEYHPEVRQIIKQNFTDYFKNQVSMIHGYREHSMRCVGSIAWNFRDVLEEVGKEYGVVIEDVKKNPMDGLVTYHSRQLIVPSEIQCN